MKHVSPRDVADIESFPLAEEIQVSFIAVWKKLMYDLVLNIWKLLGIK